VVGRAAYLDSSAFVKLVVAEPGSQALRRALARWPEVASASLLRTEAIRSLRRSGNVAVVPQALRLFRSVHLVTLDEPLLDRAGGFDPPELRSLDAVHLAAAMALGPDLGIMFVYDVRLRQAAEACGIPVGAPI
jgi:predicted nucleic acid-binding protein